MATASAPNKKRSKPDDRRPIVDRSQWPTNCLDVPAARALDWISGQFLPAHLHADLQRTDAFLPLVSCFNRGVAGSCSSGIVAGDIASCFTNIKHVHVRSAWHFYKTFLLDRAPRISAPKRHRKGTVRLGDVTQSLAGFFITFDLDDLEAIIEHHLQTGWFRLGTTLGREVEGLPMGSAIAGALTRMVLIYFDIMFRASELSRQPSLGRASSLMVMGFLVHILEVRYVDDCMTLWRGPSRLTTEVIAVIRKVLWARWLKRYPLPIEVDTSGTFVGLALTPSCDGPFSMQPMLLPEPAVYEFRDHPLFMDYRSFVSLTIKRSIVLGIAARVDAHTLPEGSKPAVLRMFLRRLVKDGGFPLRRVRGWLTVRGVSRWPWLQSAADFL
jgi:hypothetical protein